MRLEVEGPSLDDDNALELKSERRKRKKTCTTGEEEQLRTSKNVLERRAIFQVRKVDILVLHAAVHRRASKRMYQTRKATGF